MCVCDCVTVSPCLCVCACVCVCIHSPCLFSVQQNLINSAGMEIISARSAQETERDGEEDAWKGGGGGGGTMNTQISLFFFTENHSIQKNNNHFMFWINRTMIYSGSNKGNFKMLILTNHNYVTLRFSHLVYNTCLISALIYLD